MILVAERDAALNAQMGPMSGMTREHIPTGGMNYQAVVLRKASSDWSLRCHHVLIMAGEVVYISYIYISPKKAAKLASKHGLSAHEVRDTFELPGKPQRGVWHLHDEFGWRLYVEGVSPLGHRIVAILKPERNELDDWVLRTARMVY